MFPAAVRRRRCLSWCWSGTAFPWRTSSAACPGYRCFSGFGLGPPPPPPRLLVVDSDVGIDAAVALMIAMQTKAESMVLTSVFGNTAVSRATTNLCMLRSLFAKDKTIPVFPGADTSMLGRASKPQWQAHGASGLGELDADDFEFEAAESEHAANAMVRLSKEQPIDLVCLGPLTNVAIALKLDPDFLSRLHSLTIMGGAILARGTSSYASEFNFGCDPEAAHLVLSSLPNALEATLVPWETTEKSSVPHDVLVDMFQDDIRRLPIMMKSLLRPNLEHSLRFGQFNLCDVFGVVALLYPESVLEQTACSVFVELHGQHSRGMLAVDHYGLAESQPKPGHRELVIAQKIDSELVMREIRKVFYSSTLHSVAAAARRPDQQLQADADSPFSPSQPTFPHFKAKHFNSFLS